MSNSPGNTSEFQALLAVQSIDVEIDQLEYRRQHLNERAVLEDISHRARLLRSEIAAATAARDVLAEQQAALEAEVDAVTSRIAQIDARLYGSAIVSPKDAQAMSEEAVHLRQRKVALEDSDLEIMEALEPAQGALDGLNSQALDLANEMRSTQTELEIKEAEIDANLDEKSDQRLSAVEPITAELLAEYEKLRASLGGVAAAVLTGGSCGGCHLSLSGAELDRIRKAPASEVLHCEECGRILVRQ